MRYISKQMYYSMQFYKLFQSCTYEDYIVSKTEELISVKKYHQNITTVQQMFESTINHSLHRDLIYADEMKKLILDENKKIKLLNKGIYDQLQKLAERYFIFQVDIFEKLYDSENSIKNGDFSKGVKDLARMNKHDDEIKEVIYEDNRLKVIFSHGRDITYYFYTVDDWENEKLDQFLGCTALYEEIFLNDDDSFEYNILMIKTRCVDKVDALKEISIRFYDVEVEYGEFEKEAPRYRQPKN